MFTSSDKYCGDEAMEKFLRQAGSTLSMYGLYGMLYGSIAAPNMVKPSELITVIFNKEDTHFESEEWSKEFFGNLMYLWNSLAQWEPGKTSFFLPDIKYPDTNSGLKQRAKDNLLLIEYFMKGLDIGKTMEDDFTEDAIKSMESLAKVSILLAHLAGLPVIMEGEIDEDSEKTSFSIDQIEGIMAACIAAINVGLKEARMKVVDEIRLIAESEEKNCQAESSKVPRNEPCPCRSGKKYKKCCGLTH